MQITKREATKVVDKLRFRTRATHHKMASFVYEGRLILRTRISFGRGDLPQAALDAVAHAPGAVGRGQPR